MPSDSMKPISPEAVLQSLSSAIPDTCKKNFIIIGSLAAGYYFFKDKPNMVVRTKDVDCLLSPRIEAVPTGEAVTEQLFSAGWTFRSDSNWPAPGDENTPVADLPAVRLNPPDNTDWFIELLTVPESSNESNRQWIRLKTSRGFFGLCSFRFLSLTSYDPISTPFDIAIARPEMMVLANLLEHPTIGQETMSGIIQGRTIKRSNKDLGRVLAIAFLSTGRDEDVLLEWPAVWRSALQSIFTDDWPVLAHRCGSGLEELLSSPGDLEEAHHTCAYGLLASNPPTIGQLRVAGQRLLQDAIEPLI